MACKLVGTERQVPVARELTVKVKRALREQVRGLLVEHLFELGIAIAGVVACGTTGVISIKLLVGIVDAAAGQVEADFVVLTVHLWVPQRGLDDLEFAVDVNLL
jgi:hypothetical protein